MSGSFTEEAQEEKALLCNWNANRESGDLSPESDAVCESWLPCCSYTYNTHWHLWDLDGRFQSLY